MPIDTVTNRRKDSQFLNEGYPRSMVGSERHSINRIDYPRLLIWRFALSRPRAVTSVCNVVRKSRTTPIQIADGYLVSSSGGGGGAKNT